MMIVLNMFVLSYIIQMTKFTKCKKGSFAEHVYRALDRSTQSQGCFHCQVNCVKVNCP